MYSVALQADRGRYRAAAVQTVVEEDPMVEEVAHMEAVGVRKVEEAGTFPEVAAYSAEEAGNGSAKEVKPLALQQWQQLAVPRNQSVLPWLLVPL
jgi:hypothetical protein